ncbi:MAG: FecR domain-containing protein [Deltaproteobacteria bacterium]|nr:FecR domain-containing protein [Deltaproteobacteria bacterium]MBN2670188.1 FecR domain-containing protein [Deltaproteobacteria bacterium]
MKKLVIIFSIVVVALIVAGLVYTQHVSKDMLGDSENGSESSDKKVEDSAQTVRRSEGISVVDIRGDAERKTKDGAWSPMEKGDSLAVDDSVRTRNDSKVVLGLGKSSTIELNAASEIEVRELSGAMQRLGLINGRASVDYGEDGNRVLNIENSDGTVVAKVDKGKFSILNNGQIVAVATETGSVDLSAAGESVTVTEGMESVVTKGNAPTQPYEISTQTYLKLSAGACKKLSEIKAVVHGTVSVGTSVTVAGEPVTVNSDGSFISYVALSKNNRKVKLETIDVWGKVRERSIVCLAPKKRAPIKKIDIDWGKKGGK